MHQHFVKMKSSGHSQVFYCLRKSMKLFLSFAKYNIVIGPILLLPVFSGPNFYLSEYILVYFYYINRQY